MVALSVHGFFMGPWNRAEMPRPGLPMEFSAAWIRFQFAMKKLTHRAVGQVFIGSPTWAAVNVGRSA